ncbi:S-layer family protein, partial [Paenibacillus cellulosilyticus]
TVTLKDAQGNSITTGGETVVITATKGTISAVIDEGDGTYTATLTAPTTVGTSTVSATIGVNAITSTASVQIVPGTPSATISTVTVDNNTLTADGTSQATVTVTLKDAQGNAITTGGDTVVITATKGTVSAVIDEGNGTYTATLTAPTIVGNSTVSATIGGNAIASTASITFVAGTPSVTTSTVAVDNNTLTADGTSQATVTVTLKDAQGNAITTGGDTVVITATKGTVSGVIDEGDGTYTAKLTAPTTVGTSTVSATIGGNAIASTASVQFIPGTPSATTSIVAVDNNTLTADGTSQATVTVTLKDAQGNAITPGGETVVINATKGTVSAVTDKGDGTYTATLTAPTTVGTSTVSAKVGGNAIASTATVQFESGTPSASTSTVAVGVGTLTADGTSQTNVTVTLKDGQGNAITTGGTSVAIIATKGIISAVTDNGNGTYTATLTAPTTVGTSTISATIGGSAITSTATVQFIPGTPSTTTSLVSVDNSMLTADGASQATVTVTLKDAQGNEITTGGETVVITATSGTVSAVTDKGDGTYTATLTAPTTVGTSTVSAKVGGNAIASTATVQFESGTPSASTSTVAVGVGTLTADGTSQTNVTVTLKDGQGNAITTGVTSVAISATKGTVSAVTDNGNGTYTATLTAPTTVGASTISATIGGSAIASTATVQFISGTPSTTTSLVSVDNSMLTADGASQATVTVTLKDAQGNEITTGGETVVITATSGTVSAVTDKGDGTYTATLTAPTIVGTSTVSAKVGGNAIASTASVQFVPGTPSATTSIVAVDNNTLTADGTSQATVTVTLKDAQGNAITTGGETVVITATSGTVSAVTDKGDGTYTATLTAPTTVGTATLSATVGGNAITSTTSVQFVHGTPSASTSTIAVDKTTMMADGKSQTNVTVTLKDAQGNAVTVGGDSVSITVSKGTVGTVVDKGDGTYVATLTSPTAPSKVSVTAKVNGSAIVSQVEVQFTAVPSVYPMPGSDNSVPVSINASQVSGMATVRTNSDGEKWLDIQIDSTSITQALESLTNSAKQEVMVSTQYEADNYVLQLSGMAVKLLNEHDASIILATKLGQYSLPLNEIVKQGSEWNNEDVIQITIQTSQLDELSGLQEEAAESGLHLIGDPVQFEVYVLHNGESKEITTFTGYVERIMFLPTNAGEASTVMVWDATKGLRPVPTQFVEVDGRSAAVVHSITNSVYVLVSRTSTLTDIQDHWAANEISDMNRRMIINGVNGSEFAPDKAITRAELAALLARALGLPQSDQSAGFTDVSDSSWYSASIAAVKAYGLMDGYKDGTFKPNQEISRQEAIVTMIRALQLTKGEAASSSIGSEVDLGAYSDNGQVGEWARTAIQTAIQEGLMKGYGDALYPTKSLTRAETAVLLYRMLQKAGFINE